MPGPRNARRKQRAQQQKEKRQHPTSKAHHVSEVATPVPPPSILDATPKHTEAQEQNVTYKPLPSKPLRYAYTVSSSVLRPLAATNRALDASKTPDANPVGVGEQVSQASPVSKDTLPQALSTPRSPATGATPPTTDAIPPSLQFPYLTMTSLGPHVHDVSAFLDSRLAAPPSFSDALCAEYAQDEVREMLCAVLPDETADILWYNKSRATARICPVCKRLYRVGDTDALTDTDSNASSGTDVALNGERRRREQEISGICSSLCFLLAAHRRFPSALRQLWGRMASDPSLAHLDPDVLAFSDTDMIAEEGSDNPLGLSLLLQMTRFHDLGLQALLFGGRDIDVEDNDDEREGEDCLGSVDEELEDEAEQDVEDAPSPISTVSDRRDNNAS